MSRTPLALLFFILVLDTGYSSPRPPVIDPAVTQQMLHYKTEMILSRILSEVNMLEPPSITSPIHLPEEVIQLLVNKEMEESIFGEGENLIAYPLNDNSSCENDTSCAHFEFELPTDGREISSMHLWLHTRTSSLDVSVCFFTDEDVQLCEHREKVDEVRSQMGYAIFQLPTRFSDELKGDQIFCTVEIYDFSAEDHSKHKPFLVANMDPISSDRKRRSANSSGASKNCTCCLVDFFVSFKELGWHWVVAPLGFNANICYGKCSNVLNSYPSHYHRMLSTVINNKTATSEKKASLWTPCCSPTKLKPLNMIYVAAANNNTSTNHTTSFIYHKIPDMITESCGCW